MPRQFPHNGQEDFLPSLLVNFIRGGDDRAEETVVTRTPTPTKAGVLVRIEQSGFRSDEERNYQGAN